MPNYCLNRLTIDGPNNAWERFVADHEGFLTFAALAPLRHEAVLAVDVWGTKWDIVDQRVQLNREMRFETAWRPPTNWLRIVSMLHPALSFTLHYYEPGVNFQGGIVACGELRLWMTGEAEIPPCSRCDENHAVLWTIDGGNPHRCQQCQAPPPAPPAPAAPSPALVASAAADRTGFLSALIQAVAAEEDVDRPVNHFFNEDDYAPAAAPAAPVAAARPVNRNLCGRCHRPGHNRRTCTVPPRPYYPHDGPD